MSTNLDLIMLAAKSMSAAEALYKQLEDDYPKNSIEWVKDYNWDWPHAVPLDQVDFSHQAEWTANPNSKKVKIFKEKITKGLMKPSVLVKPKGSDIYVIVDGHNRGISNMQLKRPMLAWTTNTDSKNGPWDVMHDQQVRGKSVKTSNTNLDLILSAATYL